MLPITDPPLTFTTPRSALFMRGDSPRHLAKRATATADVVIIDLEDAVAPTRKDTARELTAEALQQAGSVRTWVRINSFTADDLTEVARDVAASVWPSVEALVVPKYESADDLAALDELLTQEESKKGLPHGSIGLVPLLETPRGFQKLEALADRKLDRIRTTIFGPADYAAELGVPLSPASPALRFASAQLVQATRAAGWSAPLDGPWFDLADASGLRVDCSRSKLDGFAGRLGLHPRQIDDINCGFSAVGEDSAARSIVEAWESKPDDITSISVNGRFVDYPVYAAAKQQLQA